MRKITFTDEELKIAAGQVVKTLVDSLPDPSELEQPFEYSPEFLEKMDKLIKQERRRETRARISRRVASFALALLACASVWLTIDVEARAALFSWAREVYEESFIYRFFGEKPKEGLQEYEITQVPEGYVQVASDGNETMQVRVYQRDDDSLFLMYYQMQDGWEQVIKPKNPDTNFKWKQTTVNGIVADMYSYDNCEYANELVWIDEAKGTVFHLSARLEEDDLIGVAESIRPVEK